MVTTIYTHESGLLHDTGHSHPERADRLRVIYELLDEKPFSDLPRIKAKPAKEDRLTLAHPYTYVLRMEGSIPAQGHKSVDADTILSPGSWDAALHAAGAVCDAVDDVVSGKTTRAFCPMRPPGHHAEPAVSMGFCLFNNVFIGARHAQEKHGIKKIAIVDFDVHHGNGTDSMTRRHDGSILFISTHQYPLWPMTGMEDDNEECVLNYTMPPESGSDLFRKIYSEKVFPALHDFAPDILMISAGFDAHKNDPLAQINLVEEDFRWVTEELCKIADRHCDGRVVSVLEGGYDLVALKFSVAAHLLGLSA
jgi:acetoin utilization deacetylase AcuC-like enzyme